MTARRGRRGQGTIYRRTDGKWQGQLDLGFVGGRRKRQTFTAANQDDVVAKLQAAAHAVRRGAALPPERQTFGQFLAKWKLAARPGIAERTYVGYCALLAHAERLLGAMPLVKVGPADLMRVYEERRRAGAKPMTVLHLHRAVFRCLRDAERWDDVSRNVAHLVVPPRVPRREMRAMTAQEARVLISAARGDRLEALIVVALATGARRGELLGLTWRDVDADQGTLAIRGSLLSTSDGPKIVEPKTRRSRRRVEIEPRVVAALRRHRAAQEMERRVASDAWVNLDLVFSRPDGRPVDPHHVTARWFPRLLAKACLPRMRFHDLRHTYASIALASGIHPKIVQETLGHATVAITLDLYSHVVPTLQREASRAVGDALFG